MWPLGQQPITWELVRNKDYRALTPDPLKPKVHFNKIFSVYVHSSLRNTPLNKIAPSPLKEVGKKSRKKGFSTAGGKGLKLQCCSEKALARQTGGPGGKMAH